VGEDSTDAEDGDGPASVDFAGVLEFTMSEWHVTPEYILDNWTDDMLKLMVRRLNTRLNPNKTSEDDSSTAGPLNFERLKAEQAERFKLYQQMDRKKA
jgi:hypothetical protein